MPRDTHDINNLQDTINHLHTTINRLDHIINYTHNSYPYHSYTPPFSYTHPINPYINSTSIARRPPTNFYPLFNPEYSFTYPNTPRSSAYNHSHNINTTNQPHPLNTFRRGFHNLSHTPRTEMSNPINPSRTEMSNHINPPRTEMSNHIIPPRTEMSNPINPPRTEMSNPINSPRSNRRLHQNTPYESIEISVIDSGVQPISNLLNLLNPNNTNAPSGICLKDLRLSTKIVKNTNIFEKCSICQEDMKEGEVLRTLRNCNHSFHIKCIERWLEDNKKCPHCRQNINRNNLSDINQDDPNEDDEDDEEEVI